MKRRKLGATDGPGRNWQIAEKGGTKKRRKGGICPDTTHKKKRLKERLWLHTHVHTHIYTYVMVKFLKGTNDLK